MEELFVDVELELKCQMVKLEVVDIEVHHLGLEEDHFILMIGVMNVEIEDIMHVTAIDIREIVEGMMIP